MDATSPLVASSAAAPRTSYAGWLAYAAAWIAAAGLWAFAAASSSSASPLATLPYALLVMGTAAAMGVVVWHLTAFLPWRSRRVTFYCVHAVAMSLYTAFYATSFAIPDLVRGDLAAASMVLQKESAVLLWNLLMGSWLYLMVAGLSYAIRGERARERDAKAAADARLIAQQAQLTALRAQLNPHFLFNALHTVSALIPHAPAEADRAIERLGELLRYTLADEDLVPLALEWTFVLDYLAFEQLRLGERLRVVESLDPEIAGTLVPPLILQPIVENAVRHGVAAQPAGATIRLEARSEEDALVVCVEDDGPGERRYSDNRQGLGLASVRRRLAAAFGERADLRIDAAVPGGGYRVCLSIPEENQR
ncbi:MAG TPA: histidine kinase [Vicinamibacterales bacterium]|nr:histidine kinase [Vicinamibacterales bacterium]